MASNAIYQIHKTMVFEKKDFIDLTSNCERIRDPRTHARSRPRHGPRLTIL